MSQPPSPKQQRKPSTTRAVSSPLRPKSPHTTGTSQSTPPRAQSSQGQPTQAPGAPHASAHKSRARDLLRKHYGIGVGPPPPLLGNQNDPMNMDSVAFDAKSYYDQLITTCSLPTLLKREVELLTEIRQLDSERQSLVYNHHHELIAASDTIAAMKTRAEGLDADLDMLRAAFSEISRLVTDVSTERQPKSQADTTT